MSIKTLKINAYELANWNGENLTELLNRSFQTIRFPDGSIEMKLRFATNKKVRRARQRIRIAKGKR